MRALALCAGYGGLEMGLALAGWPTQLVAYAEIDPHAAAVMAYHHPDVPNLGDLTTIVDVPQVDIVTAGFPCQPFSLAGKREGTEDERWLIDDVCRVARIAGAEWLLLENVLGLLSANGGDALARVCQAMAENGFSRWEWTTLRASDIGACHRRERWFCLATQDAYSEPRGERRQPTPGQTESGRARPEPAGRSRMVVADTDGGTVGTEQVGIRGCSNTAVAGSDQRIAWGAYADAIHRWATVLGRPAPDPTVNGRLNPVFVEWMMGLPVGHVTDVPGLSRPQQLARLGNGVVPQQAAAAITQLAARHEFVL